MSCININAHVNESLSLSDSIIQLFHNEKYLGELQGEISELNTKVHCDSTETVLYIRRKFHVQKEEMNFFAKVIVSIFHMIFLLLDGMDEFECPYECEEKITITPNEKEAHIEIECVKQKWTVFKVKATGCNIKLLKKIWVSENEVNAIYESRKKDLLTCILIPMAVLIIVLIAAGVSDNATIVIPLIIIAVIVVAMIAAFAKMEKQRSLMLAKEPMEWENVDG